METEIRTAELDDAARIAQIHVQSWRAAYSQILRPEILSRYSVQDRQEMWKQVLRLPKDEPTRMFVLTVDGNTVGFSLTLPGRDDDLDPHLTAELAGLYFVPSHWRRGLGTELQDRALDELRKQGFHDAVLWVLEENSAARAFYEFTGWKFDRKDPSYRDFQAASVRYRLVL
jgi:ribosomal protein S18 acetylase RimI-like enzyme